MSLSVEPGQEFSRRTTSCWTLSPNTHQTFGDTWTGRMEGKGRKGGGGGLGGGQERGKLEVGTVGGGGSEWEERSPLCCTKINSRDSGPDYEFSILCGQPSLARLLFSNVCLLTSSCLALSAVQPDAGYWRSYVTRPYEIKQCNCS